MSLYKFAGLFFILISFSFESFSSSDFDNISYDLSSDIELIFNIEAKISFDVDNDGNVINVNILKITPEFFLDEMFSLLNKYISKWRYQKGKPGKNLKMTIKLNVPERDFKINNCTPFKPYFTQPFKYPLRAQVLKLMGKVTFIYDINSAGLVDNVRILNSQPANLFERSVKDSVRMWRYDCFGSEVKGVVGTVLFGSHSHQ